MVAPGPDGSGAPSVFDLFENVLSMGSEVY